MLGKKDPRRAANIDRHNKRRIVRALEIVEALGLTPEGGPALEAQGSYHVLWLGINLPEKKLQENIHTRLLSRISDGMVEEAIRLHAAGLTYKRMSELGLEYRSLALLLQGKISKEMFVEELEQAINNYAKRQIRWFKRNKDIRWIKNPPGSRAGRAEALKFAEQFLTP